MNDALIWLGIALCLSQSATFSGLNLAVFSLSRLELEVAAEGGDRRARAVLALRRDANRTLTTILWGNVAINVLLTLLADSVLAGLAAFLFSTVLITIVGEVIPQAYFSRHALRVAALLAPVLRFYRVLLWPLAWPSGRLLDAWIGPEGMPWLRERDLRQIIEQHARDPKTEISRVEAIGAINFLAWTTSRWDGRASRSTRRAWSVSASRAAGRCSPTSPAGRTTPFSAGSRHRGRSGWCWPIRPAPPAWWLVPLASYARRSSVARTSTRVPSATIRSSSATPAARSARC